MEEQQPASNDSSLIYRFRINQKNSICDTVRSNQDDWNAISWSKIRVIWGSIKYTKTKPSYPSADIIKDFATNPLNNGKADIDIAPIIVHIAVIGIYLNNPPSSEALHVPTL